MHEYSLAAALCSRKVAIRVSNRILVVPALNGSHDTSLFLLHSVHCSEFLEAAVHRGYVYTSAKYMCFIHTLLCLYTFTACVVFFCNMLRAVLFNCACPMFYLLTSFLSFDLVHLI